FGCSSRLPDCLKRKASFLAPKIIERTRGIIRDTSVRTKATKREGSALIWVMTYFTNQSVQIRPRSYASCSDLPSPFGRRVGDEGLRQSSEELECLGEMISLPEPNHL